MKNEIKKILKKHWNYDNFRYPQQDVIEQSLLGKDILALMPTGGGKSICFQIPGMYRKGICVVISPLIALMKDQVKNLINFGIKAEFLTSSLSFKQIDRILDNCIYGDIKFLYIAPERIQSTLFLERFKKMKVNFLVVDEAHCISQWGHGFRPSYLKISYLREIKKEITIIALTASATIEVQKDIIEKLKFKNYETIKASFIRKNISYNIVYTENKFFTLKGILRDITDPIIIYTDTRKKTKEISQYLNHYKIDTLYYHAGLTNLERGKVQDEWFQEKKKIIVATSAFGMGIDKPNVRMVIHMDIPLSIEDFFQESGRGGRDGLLAQSITLFNNNDFCEIDRKIKDKYPPLDILKKIYERLFLYFKIPYNSIGKESYDFDIADFANKSDISIRRLYRSLEIFNNLSFLEIEYSNMNSKDRIIVNISPDDLYFYRINHLEHNKVLEPLLRIYGGDLFCAEVEVYLQKVSLNSEYSMAEIKKILYELQKKNILTFIEKTKGIKIKFIKDRPHNIDNVNFKQVYDREAVDVRKAEVMKNFLKNKYRCRSQYLLEYFGEKFTDYCKICDICKFKKRTKDKYLIFEKYFFAGRIFANLEKGINSIHKIVETIDPLSKDIILKEIRSLIKDGYLNCNYLELSITVNKSYEI